MRRSATQKDNEIIRSAEDDKSVLTGGDPGVPTHSASASTHVSQEAEAVSSIFSLQRSLHLTISARVLDLVAAASQGNLPFTGDMKQAVLLGPLRGPDYAQ